MRRLRRRVALEKYDEARHYYKAILKTFQSREVYNNAGISLLMSALEIFSNSELSFAYPVELDPEPRLSVIAGTRESKPPLSRSSGDYIEMEETIDGVRLREPTSNLVFDSLIEIINDPVRQLSAILGVKAFDQSLLLAASYQSELTLETADSSFFVLSSTLLLLHRTAANYAGQSQKGIKIGDTLDQVLKKFWKPQRTIHLTQGICWFTIGPV